jgi:hypothetical protein
MFDFRQPQLTQVQYITEFIGARLCFDDRLKAATTHPGTVTGLKEARLRFADRLKAA